MPHIVLDTRLNSLRRANALTSGPFWGTNGIPDERRMDTNAAPDRGVYFWMAGGTLQDAGGFAGAPEESLLR